MTVENLDSEAKTETVVDTTDWKAVAAKFEADAKKNEGIAKQLIADRDAAKKKIETKPKDEPNPEVMEYVKKELEGTKAQLQKYAEKAKNGAITAAATAKLTQMGINPDALTLAISQLDRSIIQYDENSDIVDDTALSTAVSKLKSQNGFLFERSLKSPTLRLASENKGGSGGDEKSVSAEEFRQMSTKEQRTKIKAGFTIRQG